MTANQPPDGVTAEIADRLRTHVHVKGWGYAGPYRCGIAAGELGLDVEPWWPTEHSCRVFRAGVEVGRERVRASIEQLQGQGVKK